MENEWDTQDSVNIEDDEIDRVIDINENDPPEGKLQVFSLMIQNFDWIVSFFLLS